MNQTKDEEKSNLRAMSNLDILCCAINFNHTLSNSSLSETHKSGNETLNSSTYQAILLHVTKSLKLQACSY